MPSEDSTPKKSVDLSALADAWPSGFVARTEAKLFSGGLTCAGTLANADCRGEGPAGRVRVGKRIGYPVPALIAWLEARTTVL